MIEDQMINEILDCRGLFCPIPIVKINKAIKTLETGQIIKVLCTDPGSQSDFPAWAKKTGNTLLESHQEEGVFTFFIQKTT